MKVKVATSPTQTQFEEVDLSITTRRGSECLIGRSPDSDLVLDSDDVSRLHGKFFYQGGHYYFSDTGSRNGSIVNGKLAQKDQSYMLQNGDIIRIGDFVLMLEEEMPDSQQAETVVRIINPSVFSNRRQNASVEAQQPEQLQVPIPQEQSLVNTSEVVEAPVEKSEPTFIQSEDVSAPDNVASSDDNNDNNINNQDEIAGAEHIEDTEHQTEDVTSSEPENQVSEHTPDYTVVQANDIDNQQGEIAGAEHIEDTEHQTEDVTSSEPENQISEHTPDYTVVQANDIDNQDEIAGAEHIEHTEHQTEDVTSSEPENQISEHTPDYTVVQANDIDNQEDEIAGAEHIEDTEHQTEDVTNSEPENQVSEHTPDYTIVQANDIDNQQGEIAGAEHIEDTEHQIEDVTSSEPENQVSEHTPDYTAVQANDIDNQNDNIAGAEHKTEDIAHQEYEDEAEEELVPELVSEEVSDITPEPENESVATQETEEVEELEEPHIQLAKVLEEKQIVLVGHESKKSELAQLVSEHEQFLSCCLTRTWQTFSDDLYKNTGLSVTQEIPPPTSGGYQAINSLVNSGEILAVIFLRDLMVPQPGQANEEALLRICNINNVLLATNLPTAQAVVHYLKNLKD